MEASREPSTPTVAVVVPTYSRSALLPRLIAGLEAQIGDLDFEVIIVDDASNDDTPAVLEQLKANSPLTLRIIRQPRNRGPATARNLGWRSTTADIVAFTDDDCTAEAGWLRTLVAGFQDADVVQGQTIADPAELDRTGPFSRTLIISREDGHYQTCNIAYRRDLLESLGGFDESFRFPAGEDTDLGWRAREAGARTQFCMDAVIRHTVRPSNLLVALKDTWRWQSTAQSIKKHPELRTQIYRPYLWRPVHKYVLMGFVGIAIAVIVPCLTSWQFWLTAWTLALWFLTPYARHRVRVEMLPGTTSPLQRLTLLPLSFILDSAEVFACVVGSIRHRTLVL